MKSLLSSLLLGNVGYAFGAAQIEEFSCQGHLEIANGNFPMTFALLDAPPPAIRSAARSAVPA